MLEGITIGIIIALLAVGTCYFYVTVKSREKLGELTVATLVLVFAVVLSTSIYSVGTSEGLPVGERFFSDTDLPPKNIIQVVKTVDWEDSESIVYLNLVPYNNVNGTRMLYRISQDDCETPINFSIGMKIVNNNGMLEQV